jgi:probable rRNA maturation factor
METIRAIKNVLRKERKRIDGVSVVYTNDSRIRLINRRHLRHDYVTDVIAFELEQSPRLETEIYINLDRAKSQARIYGQTFTDETTRLLVHGLLHVLGFNDKSKKDTALMRREEDALVEILKVKKN